MFIPAGIAVQQRNHGSGGGGSLLTNLVSWWSLDEANGTRADSHGSNDLTAVGTCAQVTGKVGSAVDFDGSNDLLYNNSTTDFQTTSAFSVQAWVYVDNVSGKKLIISDTGSSTQGWGVYAQDSDIDFYLYDGTSRVATASSVLSVTTWHHVVCIFDGSDMTIYVDNSGTTPITGLSTITAGSSALTLGASISYLYDHDGRIDEPAFWDTDLTSTDVASLWNSGSGLAYTDL